MTGQQLKNSILQMAVQGKLVPQDPNDEPASVLIERIREEKQRLIKEGKIKKEKNPSYIFRGEDNMPYEKIGNKEPVCIADEIPFDIPESWEWVRLNLLAIKEIKRGKSPKYAENSDIQVFAQKCNVKTGGINMSLAKKLDPKVFEKYPTDEYIQDNDIIINSTGNGTLGRIGIFSDSDRINDNIIVPDSHVTIVRCTKSICDNYLYYVLKYYQPYLEKLGEGSTNQTELKPITISELFIPIPPLNEQKIIVQKINSVLPLADIYGEKENELIKYNVEFPNMLKKSILQMAIQGKMVEQNSEDEPASILLQRIKAEKDTLIKAGKIKKDKNESIIYCRDNSYYEKIGKEEKCIDDEIPFDIPQSWEWTRLKNTGYTQTGNTPSKMHAEYFGSHIPFIGPGDIQNSEIIYTNQGLSELGMSYGRTAKRNSILQVCIGGSIGKSAINTEDVTFNQQINCVTPILISTIYLNYVLCSPYFIKTMKEKAGGTATPIINRGTWDDMLIPIPPYSEQSRIVTQIEMLMKQLKNL